MIEVKPVLPPISIPAVLSKYALHVGVPVNELNIAAEESTIIISLNLLGYPSSFSKFALFDIPIIVPTVSNISIKVNVNIINIPFVIV